VGLHSNWSKLSKRRKYALFVRDRDRIYGEYSTDACSRVLVVAEVLQKAASEKIAQKLTGTTTGTVAVSELIQ